MYLLQVYGLVYSWPFLIGGPSGISHLHWLAKNLLLAAPPYCCIYSYLLKTHGVFAPNVAPRLHIVIKTQTSGRNQGIGKMVRFDQAIRGFLVSNSKNHKTKKISPFLRSKMAKKNNFIFDYVTDCVLVPLFEGSKSKQSGK